VIANSAIVAILTTAKAARYGKRLLMAWYCSAVLKTLSP
jgi:hypothetical protein